MSGNHSLDERENEENERTYEGEELTIEKRGRDNTERKNIHYNYRMVNYDDDTTLGLFPPSLPSPFDLTSSTKEFWKKKAEGMKREEQSGKRTTRGSIFFRDDSLTHNFCLHTERHIHSFHCFLILPSVSILGLSCISG